MRIVAVGGGPGGLYAALLFKQADPRRTVTVLDRNPEGATYGWGVVFSDETLTFLRDSDADTYDAIAASFVRWDAIDVIYGGERIRSGGHAFSGLTRRRLLAILEDRCREVGVAVVHQHDVSGAAALTGADLIVAADGVRSTLRTERAHVFQPSFDTHSTRYIWLGTLFRLPAFTFQFVRTEFGMFQAHAYPFDRHMSTVIVECTESTWRRAGLDEADEAMNLAFCQSLFADLLVGHPLLSNRSTWSNFVTLRNETWHDGRVVLLGDAAHTAHFSIGSGTKMALEDAIALNRAVEGQENIDDALVAYEEMRQPVVDRTQQAARASAMWFEQVGRYAHLDPPQFAFSLLTRSTRITYDSLRLRDPRFSDRVDRWFAGQSGGDRDDVVPPPPVGTGVSVGGLRLANRWIGLLPSPDDATDGVPGDATITGAVRLAERGAALVMLADVAVAPEARINPGCPLLSRDSRPVWEQIVRKIRGHGSLVGVRLGHAGPRGATIHRKDGVDVPLPTGGWPLLSASALPYSPHSIPPREVTPDDMSAVCAQFVAAAREAHALRVDMLELDFAHGYLLGAFLSPLTNQRHDTYGGPLENRLRFPLAVLAAVRQVWPAQGSLTVRFSAADWASGGLSPDDALSIARAFRDTGADLIHVSSGQTTMRSAAPYGSMWQAGLSDLVRNEARVATAVSGQITGADEANTVLASGRADLCVSVHRILPVRL